MGAAYSKGFLKALIDYFTRNNLSLDVFDYEIDFAPFQPEKQHAVIRTLQFSHGFDLVAGDKEMDGAEYMDTSNESRKGHSISSFIDQVKNLPTGTYVVRNGKIVRINEDEQNTNN